MRERQRVLILILIMALSCLTVAGITIFSLYQAAISEERERLVETAQSQARLIEAVARYDAIYSKSYTPGGARAATLSQIIDAHKRYEQSGRTAEFTLAERKADSINFLLRHRHGSLEHYLNPVSFDSKLAEPMRQALLGRSGTIVGEDYRGELVLAAHEPVAELDLGIVAKVDLSEIRAPFVKAGMIAGFLSVLVVLGGVTLFVRISNPMIKLLEERNTSLEKANTKLKNEIEERSRAERAVRDSEQKYLRLVEQLQEGIWAIDKDANTTYVNFRMAEMIGI
jgi:PAS domain-containing protein